MHRDRHVHIVAPHIPAAPQAPVEKQDTVGDDRCIDGLPRLQKGYSRLYAEIAATTISWIRKIVALDILRDRIDKKDGTVKQGSTLATAFVWGDTLQGHSYWSDINYGL